MKTTKFFFAALAILAAASCAKEFDSLQAEQTPATDEGFIELTIEASIDDLTKAASLGNDLSVAWEVGDSVAVYDSVNAAANKFKVTGVNGKSVTLVGSVSEKATKIAAVYPYTAAAGFTAKDNILKVTVPATQAIASGKNIDPKALVSTAKAAVGASLAFKNTVSLVKFKLTKAGVSTVMLRGNGSEAFVGTATEAKDAFTATGKTLTVKAESGTLNAGEYYAAIVPALFNEGIKVSTTIEDAVTVKNSSKKAEFVRNSGLNIGTVQDGTALPTNIKTKDQLVSWAENCGLYPAGLTVKLGADINLAGTAWATPTAPFIGIFDGQNHRIYNVTASSAEAYAVGIVGELGDGANVAVVKNLCVGSKDYDFSTGKGTYDGLSKFTLASLDPQTTKVYSYGGVVAFVQSKGEVENVVNFAEVEAAAEGTAIHMGAGVVGAIYGASTVKNCTNYGAITDNAEKLPDSAPMGGVVGWTSGTGSKVLLCDNYGEININGPYTNSDGGIIGRVHGATAIEDCVNHADINVNTAGAAYGSYYGGITGYCPGQASFKNCKNLGNITASYDKNIFGMGGIVGCTNKAGITIEGCDNEGRLTAQAGGERALQLGGIVGYNYGPAITIKGCNNKGEIKAMAAEQEAKPQNKYIGGILGQTGGTKDDGFVISDCHNFGDVSAIVVADTCLSLNYSLGGLVGYLCHQKVTIENCSNNGTIMKEGRGLRTNMGGLFGYAASASSTVKNCTNNGPVYDCSADKRDYSYIGGLVGNSGGSTIYENCNNTAEVSVIGPIMKGTTPDGKGGVIAGCSVGTGGLAGYLGANEKMANCTNSGAVTPCATIDAETVTSPDLIIWAGGIAARCAGTLDGCENTGNIYCDPGSQLLRINVGGICCGLDGVKLIQNCSNRGKISVINCTPNADCVVGSFLGQMTYAGTYSGANYAGGEVYVEATSAKLHVGGLCGASVANKSKDSILGAGSTVDAKITVPEAVKPHTGMVVGYWRTGDTKITSFGSEESPIKVGGSLNKTAVSEGNLASMIQGSANKTDSLHVIKAVILQ